MKKIPELLKISGFIISLGFGFYFFVLVEIINDDKYYNMYREKFLFPFVIGALSLLHLYGCLIAYQGFKRLQKNPLNDTIYTIEKV